MDSLGLPKIPLLPLSRSINSNSRHYLKTLQPKFSSFDLNSLLFPRRLASISCSVDLSGSSGGGGGDDLFSGGNGGGSGGGGGDGGGEAESRSIAVGEYVSNLENDDDVIVLSVGGMTCGGCAASVKRILESQPQVSLATVNFEKKTALIWAVPEVKVTHNWKQELGEKLAKHLTTCGFKSDLQGRGAGVGENLLT